ncbi:primosomal protein DnaI [Ectobacillus ponti]|uniref:Primosomal protein DnaI n=1 Tax=Ectobacillus ponti TaxID=2961894 RepID=A0AA41X580_9BACI|nr:primosomal protein DnaI [Ectobacillus ponti]MCP8967413.1 primosomal protein DnaI [Ectobacillus ponti]
MEHIGQALARLAQNQGFMKQYEEMKRQVMQHPYIQQFVRENEEVTTSMLERNLGTLYEYIGQSVECQGCESLEGCKNILPGYHPHLRVRGKAIDLQYERCPRKVMDDEKRQQESLIQSLYMPKEVASATMQEVLGFDHRRIGAVKAAADFLKEYEPGKRQKSLYLYGNFGVGKTYILGAVANGLAKKGVPSMLVYLPDFLREIKGSIGDNTMNSKIEKVKRVPVLMLDDIGAEGMSSFVRDDVLGSILQFRMLENLPTFFTSNLDFEELEDHFAFTQRGDEERAKARRIMERIKYLAVPVEVRGINHREG